MSVYQLYLDVGRRIGEHPEGSDYGQSQQTSEHQRPEDRSERERAQGPVVSPQLDREDTGKERHT